MLTATGRQGHAQHSAAPAREPESEPDWAALNLIGASASFRRVLASLCQWSRVDATVLIGGETGTGKELAARAIHYLGARQDGPFVPVNCGAITDSLLEAELFGHVRGAFTDAKQDARGMIALAQGGTLFLDEVDSLSPRAQAAILRFVQDHSYRPVGGARFQCGDVRVIAASNADLEALAAEGRFRRDLLYRLNLLTVTLPPLREREGDAVLLARVFTERLCRQYGVPRTLDDASLAALRAGQPWPGNVRELEHRVHRAFLTAQGQSITLGLPLPAGFAPLPRAGTTAPSPIAFARAKAQVIAEFERRYVLDLLAEAKGNLSLAARLAGKERSRFGKLVRKYGLQRDADARPPRD
ncbi:sigma 54-interacting transcriptional regulator [Ramlibacter sp. USB13]|uniref:Sigma 54-interacting transcriptional regulator n=1 Tax=Ramlibacter cellulosilyticus TaxID=2764187 RepID=A0A923MQM6_9BURK|nr:sigma 54-interacting transcriptional regulator [Ramlibacter cellulosilyticus]MBC5783420.1 sigma 54-interacting transcriptional regulator [Ramlibacter cellulosilyticus]